jgi:hypothetical protein
VGGPCWNARGNRIFYSSGGALGYRTLHMITIDLAHPERPVEPVATSIWRVPVDGGEETKVLDGLSYSFNFAVTARGIYLLAFRAAPPVASIEFFDFATRRTTVLHTLDRPFFFGFALAPDEGSILFSKADSHGSDLMMFENLR